MNQNYTPLNDSLLTTRNFQEFMNEDLTATDVNISAIMNAYIESLLETNGTKEENPPDLLCQSCTNPPVGPTSACYVIM